ncbi:MAG TPA: 2-phospho-L-lactate guanylyltransferase [Candidatus Acidoferrum sp.]|nr:2-phospho-L-lactate guanylyltransferase [Candidatus Acidoferrum sp.]
MVLILPSLEERPHAMLRLLRFDTMASAACVLIHSKKANDIMPSDGPLTETPGPRDSNLSGGTQPAISPPAIRALLLPVKDLRNAKQRLAPVLSLEERFGLAHAMLQDTLRVIRGMQGGAKVFVVTNYAPVMEAAASSGWEILREEKQISESDSVDSASRLCAERGVTALLRLPLDLPLVQSVDIDELFSVECSAPSAILVPSRDGTGTNAILRTPPTLFPSHFGPNSFAKHQAEAKRTGAAIIVKRNARLELDVDDEADLRALLQQGLSHTITGAWLEQSGVAARFRPRGTAACSNHFA